MGFHVAVVIVLSIVNGFNFSKWKHTKDEVVWVSLPKGTTDTPGSQMKKSQNLPQTTIQEQKEAMKSAPQGQKKADMTYKPPVVQKKITKPVPQRPGLPDSRISNALAKMQKFAAKKDAPPEAAQIPDQQAGGFTYGTSKGPYVAPNDPEYVMYQAKIQKKVMDEWILPLKYTEQATGLVARLIVHINEKGEVIQTEWDKKSGDPVFDMSTQRAVEKAAPLDLPPERLKNEVFSEGFAIEFSPLAKQ